MVCLERFQQNPALGNGRGEVSHIVSEHIGSVLSWSRSFVGNIIELSHGLESSLKKVAALLA